VASILHNLGVLQGDKNEFVQAEQSLQESLQIYRKLAQINPETYLPDVAMNLNSLGVLQSDKNEFEQKQRSPIKKHYR